MAKTTPLASSFHHIYTLPPPLPCPKVIYMMFIVFAAMSTRQKKPIDILDRGSAWLRPLPRMLMEYGP
jgi:hypothetical protein